MVVIIVPICIALCGTFMSASGYTLQKVAHNRAAEAAAALDDDAADDGGDGAGAGTGDVGGGSSNGVAPLSAEQKAHAQPRLSGVLVELEVPHVLSPASSGSADSPDRGQSQLSVVAPGSAPSRSQQPPRARSEFTMNTGSMRASRRMSFGDHKMPVRASSMRSLKRFSSMDGLQLSVATLSSGPKPSFLKRCCCRRKSDSPATDPLLAGADTPHTAAAKSYAGYWQFSAGLMLLIAGAVCTVLILGMAGQSQMAPMGACTLVFNSILANRALGEPLYMLDYISTFLMIAGTVTALVTSRSHNQKYDLNDIKLFIDRDATAILASILALVIATAFLYMMTIGARSVETLSPRLRSFDCFIRAFTAGLIAGCTGFFSKAVSSVLFSCVRKSSGEEMTHLLFYVLLAGLACCLVTQVRLLNSGFSRHDTVSVVPVYQSTLVLGGIMSGWIFYDEVHYQTTTSKTCLLLGALCTCIGIGVLSLKRPPADDADVDPVPQAGGSTGAGTGIGKSDVPQLHRGQSGATLTSAGTAAHSSLHLPEAAAVNDSLL